MNRFPSSIPVTSDIPFFSSLHGEEQRKLRGIDRRDLKAAVKYGLKERAGSRAGEIRWKYTYANVVYITDETSTREITSWVQPLDVPMAPLSEQHFADHEAAKERLERNPSLCTSHTVIVVDHSASMRTSDVSDFRTRAEAVFGMLALQFVAKQRLTGERTNTDVVSLVLMHDWVEIVFEREPVGLVLYNKFVLLHDHVRPRSHGNFLPSISLVEEMLRVDYEASATCALGFFFLSDGRPSDNATGLFRGNEKATSEHISNRVALLAGAFRNRLSVHILGFASEEQNFSVLEEMAKAARSGGAVAEFIRPQLSSAGLGSAIARSASSLSRTRSILTTLAASGGVPRVLRQVERESPHAGDSWSLAPNGHATGVDSNWVVHARDVKRYIFCGSAMQAGDPWIRTDLISSEATGIAVHRKAFGEGAERLVFKLQEYNARTGENMLAKFVAKESKHERQQDLKMTFHKCFARTQVTAMKIANRFNQQVRERLSVIDPSNTQLSRVFGIAFLPCSVYTFMENGVERSVLAEKYLPHTQYMKWNGNNGYVRGFERALPRAGGAQGSPHFTDRTRRSLVDNDMGGGPAIPTIPEGDENYDSDGASSTVSLRNPEAIDYGLQQAVLDTTFVVSGGRKRNTNAPLAFDPKAEDFLQAFSHFSYTHSERRMLVCDLQGVMSHAGVSPDDILAGVFELTDPVIHYRSSTGRKQVYGKTDLGKKGVHRFFETHDCNDVCRLLGLPHNSSVPGADGRGSKRRKTGPQPFQRMQ